MPAERAAMARAVHPMRSFRLLPFNCLPMNDFHLSDPLLRASSMRVAAASFDASPSTSAPRRAPDAAGRVVR
jgi:hypothetical protein